MSYESHFLFVSRDSWSLQLCKYKWACYLPVFRCAQYSHRNWLTFGGVYCLLHQGDRPCSKGVWNAGHFLQEYTVKHHRRPSYSPDLTYRLVYVQVVVSKMFHRHIFACILCVTRLSYAPPHNSPHFTIKEYEMTCYTKFTIHFDLFFPKAFPQNFVLKCVVLRG